MSLPSVHSLEGGGFLLYSLTAHGFGDVVRQERKDTHLK